MTAKPKTKRASRKPKYEWDAAKVKALRGHLGLTQTKMSEELGVRQQTISEWECGLYQPRGPSVKLLSLVAERAQFKYGEEAENAS
jgi:DNA-binding transcriptional regulator YiaG